MPDGGARGFDRAAARIGLGLLQLQARAADPGSQPGWVNRRVEQLEFLDTRAVRWRVSVDFTVPQGAPSRELGTERFLLVPVASLAKAQLVSFDLRDEQSATLWMPTARETAHCLASALTHWASQDLKMSPELLPAGLVEDLARVVSADPPELRARPPSVLTAAALIDANRGYRRARQSLLRAQRELASIRRSQFRRRYATQGRVNRALTQLARAERLRLAVRRQWEQVDEEVGHLAYRLMAGTSFRSRIEELAQNFVVYIGARNQPGSRRVVKLSYESEVTFARSTGRFRRFLQSLGWRCWQVDLLIGGRGGTYHLEVKAPTGVDVVGIAADPLRAGAPAERTGLMRRVLRTAGLVTTKQWWRHLFWWRPDASVVAPGYLPHVHIHLPAAASARYRAAIFVRVSRPGWLTASWLVALVIGAVITTGRLNLDAVYSAHATGEAGTAATLLLALLGVFATMLVRPSEHPLASRLLLLARLLILADAGAVLVGVGNLILHLPQRPVPAGLWTTLTSIAVAIAALFTVSWLAPVARLPRRE
jgi:hypothetical protein